MAVRSRLSSSFRRLYTTASAADILLWSHAGEETAAPSSTVQILSWGRGSSGQLGGRKEEIRFYPTPVASLRLRPDFRLAPVQGRLPLHPAPLPPDLAGSSAPVEVEISCGLFHSALLVDGRFWIWGKGDGGRLGFGDETSVFVPTKEFTWNPELESVIKRRWLQQAAIRYSDTLSKWRASGGKPSRIPEHVWDSWQKEWSTLEFKQRSTITSKNRLSETGGSGSGPSQHTGGSISMVERSVRMTKELGREPNPIELFEATHTKKTASGIEYVDQRSKAVADRVQALRETASQPVEGSNESCEPDLRQLFLEAAGGKRKQRVYGMGTKASDFYSSTSSFHSTATSRDINVEQLRDTIKQEMMQEMQQEVQMMLESQRQQMREEMREEFRLEMRQLIAEMTRSTRDATAPAPQRDPPHPHSDDDSM